MSVVNLVECRIAGVGALCALFLFTASVGHASAGTDDAGAPPTIEQMSAKAQAKADRGRKFAVTDVTIAKGNLIVIGTTLKPNQKVVLDGEYTTKSDGTRVFLFKKTYRPVSCIVKVKSGNKTIKAIVQYCGPEGPAGPAGKKGATGPQGSKGATGAKGAQGITGPQGVQGLTGPQGVQGAQGATGAQGANNILDVASLHAVIGLIPQSAGGEYHFAAPPAAVTVANGQRMIATATAVLDIASVSLAFGYNICHQPTSGGALTTFTPASNLYILNARELLTISAELVFATGGDFNVGFCIQNPSANTFNNNGFVDGWVMVAN